MNVEQWQIDMARRTPPPIDAFVEGSTPVISFGDPLVAEVATIGINPSRREFLDTDGRWLRDPEQRLATLKSLGAVPGQELTDEQALEVLGWCNNYFDRNPFCTWFKPLNTLLADATGTMYGDSTACHLDLVQWATDPVWGGLGSADRTVLLDEGRPHLVRLLSDSNVRLVLANGRAVIDQLAKIGLVEWRKVGILPFGEKTCTLVEGGSDGVRLIGWSTNLQNSFGVSNEFKALLAQRLRSMLETPTPPVTDRAPVWKSEEVLELDADGHIPHRITVEGKSQLNLLLRQWFEQSAASTLGDVGTFGGRPAVVVDLGAHTVVLNVDTKRAAVGAYLAHVRSDSTDPRWRVVANSRGTVNKVVFSDDPAQAAGWYMYLTKPLDGAASI